MGRIVGIDLGTTYSLVAYTDAATRKPVCLADEQGRTLLPSVVSLDPAGSVVVGWPARERLLRQAERTVYSVKRLMGKGLEDVREELQLFPFRLAPGSESVIRIQLGEKIFTPPEISAFILRELKRRAEAFFSEEVSRAVITVPAYFNDAQRQATKDAGRIAGLEVERLVNEPTAASLAYGLDKHQRALIGVYDFGGGTFDISLLRLQEGLFEVLATNGDTHLGGDDIDNLLAEKARAEIHQQLKLDVAENPELYQSLRNAVIAAKHALSAEERTTLRFPLDARGDYVRELTRAEFESWIEPIIERTLGPAKRALKDAGLKPEQMDEVVLVGGSTRIPLVRRRVEQLFRRRPHCELNPDEVVALGAALQANILAGGVEDMLLLDVTPLSLGIETLGGAVAKIIPRNSTIPASATEMFTTYADNQTGVDIHVVQGERELVKDCRSLARFTLKIPPQPAGLPRVEVKFLIDADGLLQVTARDIRTGQQASVEVKPSYGLSDDEVERMILESIEYAEADFAATQLIGARNEADAVLRATARALAEPQAQELAPEERREIEQAEAALRQALAGDDYRLIRERIEALNQATHHLAEMLMNAAMQTALKGKRADEVNL
ncbi:MAG: Fe-S protein assembly chaperone HscA [Acidobacteria bacterium]|nr:Fe-S protein assembly chaperone HscA [Acidobacteriota bacterium]